tara:strand:- start:107 stop:229 length:123 start_codon:yes stop_codon:yes gene_type:complete
MEGLPVMDFILTLTRLEKLTKSLKEKGILEDNYKEDSITA